MADVRPRFADRRGCLRGPRAERGRQESDELYLLSAAATANVKIRDELMDIKVLREVDADGLERWEPVLKAGFPLPAADVAHGLRGARDRPDAARRERPTRSSSSSRSSSDRRARSAPSKVHKRRVRYTVGGCTAEVSDVVADGEATRTIAIESEDAAAVVAAVRVVGPRGLRQHELSAAAWPRSSTASPRATR